MRRSRRGDLDPFIVMDVVEAARKVEAQGRRVIHMEVGQPGTGAPQEAVKRLQQDLAADPLGYTVSLGLPALRERIARLYGEWYDVDLDPARVVITSGASGGFLLAFTALFDGGARVGLGAPCYPSYRQILKGLGHEPVVLRTRREARFQPVPRDVKEHRLDGLIVASPANPTGTMLGQSELADLSAACNDADASLISDEIYHGIEYEAPAVTALSATDNVYVINSFSKYFSMTGWRIGWMVVPPDHVRTVERIAQNLFICAPHAAQKLALYAMDCGDELRKNLDVYRENRALMLEGLPKAGFDKIAPPDGAFYVYADVSGLCDDSRDFASELLEKAGVAVTPGLDFDPDEGHRWMRFSYARATADIEEGLSRLAAYMKERVR
ncbi:MAG: aminotransferase class I/II-fold pyridoxal phosphate-dependent enzyme [Marivivens sp.]|nr:aminotransferase class I/II-fold pyridoxal phosphate-dependent enzyme [Marivivens sp.]